MLYQKNTYLFYAEQVYAKSANAHTVYVLLVQCFMYKMFLHYKLQKLFVLTNSTLKYACQHWEMHNIM